MFGNVSSRKEMALNELVFWDSKDGIMPLTLEYSARKLALGEFMERDF